MSDSITGYLKIDRFSSNTYSDFMNALLDLKKKGMQQLILDLRNNGGGVLDEAVEIADEFLSGDKMITYFDSPEIYRDLMITKLVGKQWDKPVTLGKDFTTKLDETGATLTPDGMTLYFAYEAPGSKTGKDIYVSTRTESTSWTKPERLGDNINSAYDDDCPTMWIDGKTLFFASRGQAIQRHCLSEQT